MRRYKKSTGKGQGTMTNRRTFEVKELEALFKYIPSTKLLHFRQVSKEWDKATKPVLQKRRDIKLFLTTDISDGRSNWKFLQFLNNSPKNVFVAPLIHIKNANKSNQDLEEGRICIPFEVIREICNILGKRGMIQKLMIEDGKNAPHFTSNFVLTLLNLEHLSSQETMELSYLKDYSALKALATSEQYSPIQLPSLKEIHSEYKYGYGYGVHFKEAVILLEIILKSSPNIESITGDRLYLRDLNIIPMLRDTGRLSKMKGVTLTKAADLEILIQCKPEIVLHSFAIDSEDVDSKKLFTFLQQQAQSLKTLKFEGNCSASESVLTLPLLPILETLSFKSWDTGCLLSVNYGRQTPVIKTLKISCGEDFHPWEEFLFYKISIERPPCPSLEKLDIFMSSPTTQRMFANWKNLFPNVKKLTIDYINEPEEFDFDSASKCWPNLEELKLKLYTGYHHEEYEDRNLDEIAFGMSSDYWRKLKKEIDMTKDEWWMKISAPEIKGTVANFKNLQKLEVSVEGFYGVAHLTDFAVYFGLRHMQNLKEIDITTTHQGQLEMEDVSTDAFNFLVKNLPNLEKLLLAYQFWWRREK